MTLALSCERVTVRRGGLTVLRDVEMALERGSMTYLHGPNGSGKTSLLRVLAGVGALAAGRVSRTAGCAFVPEKVALAPTMLCGEWLRAMRRLRGRPSVAWSVPVQAAGLDRAILTSATSSMSKGMLQRLALIEACVSEVGLLVLDEPFAGLDESGRDWLASELDRVTASGAGVIFTDHSRAATGRLRVSSGYGLREGYCVPDDGRVLEKTVTVRATHPEKPPWSRAVASSQSDEQIRYLLDNGWHIEEVRP